MDLFFFILSSSLLFFFFEHVLPALKGGKGSACVCEKEKAL